MEPPALAIPMDIGRETLERMSKVDRYNAWLFSKVAAHVGDRVLEVGSGTGNMSEFILDRSKVVLTDLSEYYHRELQRLHGHRGNVLVKTWNLEDPPDAEIRDARVDTILCLNVLEHVRRDDRALANMAEALVPGGTLLLLVPSVKLLYGSLDVHLEHFRRYGRRELLEKLRGAGFTVERLFSMNFFGMVGWFLNSRVFRRRILSTQQLFLFNKLSPLFIALERRLPIPVGLSLVAVARRPQAG